MSEMENARSQMERAKQDLVVSREAATTVGAPHARWVVEMQACQEKIVNDAKVASAKVRETIGTVSSALGIVGALVEQTSETQQAMRTEAEQVGVSYSTARDSTAEALGRTTTTLGNDDKISTQIANLQYRSDRIAYGGNVITERARKAADLTPRWTEILQGAARRLQEVRDGVDMIVREMGEEALRGAFSPTNSQLMGEMREIGEDGDAAVYNTTIGMIDRRIENW